MVTDGGEKDSGHVAEWRFAQAAAAAKDEGALAVADDKMSILAVRFKINASVDAHDPRPVLPLAHGDPSVFPAFRIAAEAKDAMATAIWTGKYNYYPTGVGLPDARWYVRTVWLLEDLFIVPCQTWRAPLRIEGRRWCVQDLPAAAWHRPQARVLMCAVNSFL